MARRPFAPMAVWNSATFFATAAYGFTTAAVVYRSIGQAAFGLFATIGAFRGLILLLDGGLATGLAREVALAETGDEGAPARVRAAARVYAGLALAALVVGFLASGLPGLLLGLGGEASTVARRVTILLAVETALALAAGPLPAILRGAQRFDALAVSTIAQAALGVALLFAFVGRWGLVGAALAAVCARASVATATALWMSRRRLFGFAQSATSAGSLREVTRFAMPLWIAAIGAQLGLASDLPIVGGFFGDATASSFALGARIPAAGAGLLFAVLGPSLPRLVQALPLVRRQLTSSLLCLACVLAGAGYGFAWLFAEDLCLLWVAAAPPLATLVLRIYAIAWALNAPALVLSSLAIATGKHRVLAAVVLTEAVANVGLSLVLAAAGLASGPAWATLITLSISNLVVVPLLLVPRLRLPWPMVLRPVGVGLVLGALVSLSAHATGAGFAESTPLRLAIGGFVLLALLGLVLDLTVRGNSLLGRLWRITKRGGWPHWLRQRREVSALRRQLATPPTLWLPSEPPLVTVRIATYNRGPLVAERAIASALDQSYAKLEVIVVGDCCDEATERAVRAVRDPRLRFENLAERGRYPADPLLRWMVAGTAPMNHAQTVLMQGAWLAPLDDDDEFTTDHVATLLEACRSRELDFAYGAALSETRDGEWVRQGSWPPRRGSIIHASVLYSARLAKLELDAESWRLDEPADWNLWSRFRRAGARMGFVDDVVCRHYAEQREVEARQPPWLGGMPVEAIPAGP